MEVEFEQDYENTNEILPDESASNVRSGSSSRNSGSAIQIDIILFSNRHSGFNMADAIMNVLNEYGLGEKALVLTTDNASAMIVCSKYLSYLSDELELEFDNLAFSHYRCSAHVLNLAISQEIELIDDSIIKWNSTYYMLIKWNKMEPALNLLSADNPNVQQKYLTDID
ncbi:14693_t:CDS:2 [Funneliformis geosporum]|nr:14693_t:CDS:2 [Funneliformis geosporum]